MIVRKAPSIYNDEEILEIVCEDCGNKMYINSSTYLRWREQKLNIECVCGEYATNKSVFMIT
jgi:hypothetical protein